jgi:hypothetical protein
MPKPEQRSAYYTTMKRLQRQWDKRAYDSILLERCRASIARSRELLRLPVRGAGPRALARKRDAIAPWASPWVVRRCKPQ